MYIMILFAIPGVPIRQTKIISVVPVTHPEKIRVVRLDLKLYFLPFFNTDAGDDYESLLCLAGQTDNLQNIF